MRSEIKRENWQTLMTAMLKDLQPILNQKQRQLLAEDHLSMKMEV